MAKKKEVKESPNTDILFKKVDDILKRVEVLELDIREIAIEVLNISSDNEEKLSLLDRIRNRLGL